MLFLVCRGGGGGTEGFALSFLAFGGGDGGTLGPELALESLRGRLEPDWDSFLQPVLFYEPDWDSFLVPVVISELDLDSYVLPVVISELDSDWDFFGLSVT